MGRTFIFLLPQYRQTLITVQKKLQNPAQSLFSDPNGLEETPSGADKNPAEIQLLESDLFLECVCVCLYNNIYPLKLAVFMCRCLISVCKSLMFLKTQRFGSQTEVSEKLTSRRKTSRNDLKLHNILVCTQHHNLLMFSFIKNVQYDSFIHELKK